MSLAPDTQPLAKPESLLRVPVGLASPLWGLFAGAAVSGAAWWWMTRWARPQNLEAMFVAAGTGEPVGNPALAAVETSVAEPLQIAEAVAPVVEAVIEAAPEPVADPVAAAEYEVIAEAAPEPAIEMVAVSEPEIVEPVVVAGGAADVALETAAEAKPRKKAAASKPD